MTTLQLAEEPRVLLEDVPWKSYTQMLRALDERSAVRLTYDRGNLEIMTISHEHESLAEFLGLLVFVLLIELGYSFKVGGSTTYRRQPKRGGLEPDKSWWIRSEPSVRGKQHIDLKIDPPPDLAIEVDITHGSLNRMGIYAKLGIGEVWRFDSRDMSFHLLRPDGQYSEIKASQVFPGLKPADLTKFLGMRNQLEESVVIQRFTAWVRKRKIAGWK